MKIRVWSVVVVLSCLLTADSLAGYRVSTQVEPAQGGFRYVWTVYNEDQSSGLDVFVVEAPVGTVPLAYTVPPPYSNPEGSGAQWVFQESQEAQVDPNGGRTWLSAPRAGMKWLIWAGAQPPSVYPAGTAASFSVTTDAAFKPGVSKGVATSYTPQNDPHYYQPFFGEIIGPSEAALDSDRLAVLARVDFHPAASPHLASSTDEGRPVATSLDLYPGITIEGEIGRTYAIEFLTDLERGDWQTLVNITLQSAKQVWFDRQSASSNQRRFYRVVPGRGGISAE